MNDDKERREREERMMNDGEYNKPRASSEDKPNDKVSEKEQWECWKVGH